MKPCEFGAGRRWASTGLVPLGTFRDAWITPRRALQRLVGTAIFLARPSSGAASLVAPVFVEICHRDARRSRAAAVVRRPLKRSVGAAEEHTDPATHASLRREMNEAVVSRYSTHANAGPRRVRSKL